MCFGSYHYAQPGSRVDDPCWRCSRQKICKFYSENNYLINQRVICNKEIGKVVKPENDYGNGIWVYLESRGFASCYDPHNVKPLPNGEL